MISQKIINWYLNKGYDIAKMEEAAMIKGCHLSRFHAAVEHCYTKITNGKEIAPHEIFRYIVNVAKNLNLDDYAGEEKLLFRAREKLKDLRRVNKILIFAYLSMLAVALYATWGK